MKQILTLLTLVFLSSQYLSAQVKSDDSTIRRIDKTGTKKDIEFIATHVSHNDQTQLTTFTGKVSFKTDKLQCSDAEKVVYDNKAKKLVIYGLGSFVFDGKVTVKESSSKDNTVEYTLGEDTVYIL